MREVEFRGKRLDNGEWIQGSLLTEGKSRKIVVPKEDMVGCMVTMYPVNPETVGQYTGLEDKNGNKIFEGDVLGDTLGWVYQVMWDSDNGRFLGHHSKPRGDMYICYVGREPKSKIIGNIHDNPELMEV